MFDGRGEERVVGPPKAVSALRLPSAENADSANTCAFYGMPGSRTSESENQIEA